MSCMHAEINMTAVTASMEARELAAATKSDHTPPRAEEGLFSAGERGSGGELMG
jgi:hypothetical protein